MDTEEKSKVPLRNEVNMVSIYDLLESSLFEIYVFDSLTLKFKYANPFALSNLRYSLAEILKLTPLDICPEYSETSLRSMLHPLQPSSSNKLIFETSHRRSDGSLYPVEVHLQCGKSDNEFVFLALIKEDKEITQAEDLVHMRLELMDYSAAHSLDEVLQKTLDLVEKIIGSTIGFYHFVDNDQKSLTLQQWSSRTVKEFCRAEGQGLHYALEDAGVWVDCVFTKKPVIHNDYASLPHRKGMPEGHATLVRELVVPIIRSGKIVAILGTGNKPDDFTESDVNIVSYFADMAWEIAVRKRSEEEIIRQLSEKEALLKEVHHRIKNNITSVESLLYLQSRTLTNPEAISALQNAMNRVKSMRVLYDKLLLTGEYEETSIKDYLDNLIGNIIEVFPDNIPITLEKRIDDFNIDSRHLFPVGIIINELITNTMKYAFAGKDSGLIKLDLRKKGKQVTLVVRDNGCGLPENFEFDRSKGFGFLLVHMLSDQLNGAFSIENDDGTKSTVIFDV